MNDNPLQHYIIPNDNPNPWTIARVSAIVADMTDKVIFDAIFAEAKATGITDLYLIDKQFVHDALQEKAERENQQPLTIEELKQMHGEPVWIEDEKCWGIINSEDYGPWKDMPFVTFYYKSVRCEWDIEKRGLTCYRHKPKEEQK